MDRTVARRKSGRRLRRRQHIRKRVQGVDGRLRLSVYRSLGHIYAQLIDDAAGRTVVAASTLSKDLRGKLKATGNCDAAREVGRRLAEKAKEAGVVRVVFDRNGFKYHGRVKALAGGAREGGLEF